MSIDNQMRLITLAEGSVKTLFALCKEGESKSNSQFILENMQRWLASLIDANYSRREIIDYFYSWQRDFEGNECIDEKIKLVFASNSELNGEHIYHNWIDTWVENS